jgi:hypothetical protein
MNDRGWFQLMEVRLLVRSNEGSRGRALGVVFALAMAGMLMSAQTAVGAGDPIASGTFGLNLSNGFKKQLKQNGVKLLPKKLKIKGGSSLDPTTGVGTIRLGKITFKKGGKKLVYGNAKAILGSKGRISGSGGKLFHLSKGTVARNGFGAIVSGVKVKLLASAAKKINKKLGLHSLHGGSAGKLTVAEQPETVQVTSGFAFVRIPSGYLPTSPLGPNTDPNTVAAKQPSHCIGPAGGVAVIPGDPSNPARLSTAIAPDPVLGPPPAGVAALFRFPVVGGTVGPNGHDGVLNMSGGVRLETGSSTLDNALFPQPSSCAKETQGTSTSHSYLDTTNLAPNLALGNIQSNAFLGGISPGCNVTPPPSGCAIFGGDKGVAIGQNIDLSGATVGADANAKTVAINNALIANNATSTLVLSGLFPNASGNPAQDFKDGDKFGLANLQVNTR